VRHAAGVPLARLPGWVVDNATSVRREAEPYRSMTPAERWEITRRCCRSALAMLQRSPHAERALAHVDPLPPSTVEALARLRAEYAALGRTRPDGREPLIPTRRR
jgi:hypothetical protein